MNSDCFALQSNEPKKIEKKEGKIPSITNITTNRLNFAKAFEDLLDLLFRDILGDLTENDGLSLELRERMIGR